MRERPLVGILRPGLAVDEIAREPEIRTAPRVFVAVKLLAPEPAVLAAEADAVQFAGLAYGDVHIEAQREFDLLFQDAAHDPLPVDHRRLEIGVCAVVVERDGLYAKESQEFHAGDKIRLDIGGEEKEYEVLAVAGAVHDLTLDSSLGGYEAVVFSKEQFQAIFPDDTDPLVCAFDAEESTFAEVNSEAEQITSQLNSSMITRLSEEREFDEIQSTYRIVGIVLAAVFAVIGILNLINVILTGAIARQNEFAVMRSIGMSQRQLKKLFIYEGVLYALLAGAVGITVSAAVSLTAVKAIVSNWWFARYSLSVLPAFEAALICSLLAAGIAWVIDCMWNKGSIVEKLRRIE